MHPSEVNRVRKEIWRLTLAAYDMRLVAETAEAMVDDERMRSDEVLEAEMVVTYCRSFSGPPKEGRKPEHVIDELAPEGNLDAILFELRSKLLVHTDEDYKHKRKAVDVFGDHTHSVEYRHLNPELFPSIRALALGLADRFKTAQSEREQLLRDAGVKPTLYLEESQ